MNFVTKFSIGQRVRFKHITFEIGQIRILTFGPSHTLVEYRPRYSTGRHGVWRAESLLCLAH